MKFHDRRQAGRKLAQALMRLGPIPDPIVLALPRGGLPVAQEIVHLLHMPLDILLVRKLGVPGQDELAMGALALGNTLVFNEDVIRRLNISDSEITQKLWQEKRELDRRNRLYRQNRPAPDVKGKSVIVVDDGLATGATMRAAIAALRHQSPQQIIAAVPVAPGNVYQTLSQADDVICLSTTEPFLGVGMHYDDFSQLTDQEVESMLQQEVQPAV
jgi:putative phosphoribosyl transferase